MVPFKLQRAKSGLSAFKVYVVSDSYFGPFATAAVELRQEKAVEQKKIAKPQPPPKKGNAKKPEGKKEGEDKTQDNEETEGDTPEDKEE